MESKIRKILKSKLVISNPKGLSYCVDDLVKFITKRNLFIFTIKIKKDSWSYKNGDILHIPVYAKSMYHAIEKFDNKFNSAESHLPSFDLINSEECDNKGFFKTIY